MASRPTAAAYLAKAQGKAKSVAAAKKQEAAPRVAPSFSLSDSLESSSPNAQGDITPERYPSAVSHTWVGHSAVSDIINSIDSAKNTIGANKSDKKAVHVAQENQQREIAAHLSRAKNYLGNHLAAHKAGDVETSLASLNKALDHVHDAHNVLTQSSKFTRSGDSAENVISLKNLPSTLGDISRGYFNHLKKQGSRGSVPGVTDNIMNVRSYTSGVNSESYIKPSGLIQPKAPKAAANPNAPKEPKLPRNTVGKAQRQKSFDDRASRLALLKESGIYVGDTAEPKSDNEGFRRALANRVVAPHWTRNNPGMAMPAEHRDNPVAYIATNNADAKNQKINIPRSMVDAYLTKGDAENVKRIANVYDDSEGTTKRDTKNRAKEPAYNVPVDEAAPVKEMDESAFEEYKRPSGLNVHFSDGVSGSTSSYLTGRGK